MIIKITVIIWLAFKIYIRKMMLLNMDFLVLKNTVHNWPAHVLYDEMWMCRGGVNAPGVTDIVKIRSKIVKILMVFTNVD
jgi:hypothetical protein